MFIIEDIKFRRSKDMNSSFSVRYVTEILGENFLFLCVGEYFKFRDRRSVNIVVNE